MTTTLQNSRLTSLARPIGTTRRRTGWPAPRPPLPEISTSPGYTCRHLLQPTSWRRAARLLRHWHLPTAANSTGRRRRCRTARTLRSKRRCSLQVEPLGVPLSPPAGLWRRPPPVALRLVALWVSVVPTAPQPQPLRVVCRPPRWFLVEPFGVAQPHLLVGPFVVVGAGAVARAQRTGRRMCSGRPQLPLPRVPLQPLQLSPPPLLVSLELPPPPLVAAHHPAPVVVVVPTRVGAAEAAAAMAGDPRVVQLQPRRPPLVVAAPQVEKTSSRLWWTSCENSRRGVQLKRTGTRSLSWR